MKKVKVQFLYIIIICRPNLCIVNFICIKGFFLVHMKTAIPNTAELIVHWEAYIPVLLCSMECTKQIYYKNRKKNISIVITISNDSQYMYILIYAKVINTHSWTGAIFIFAPALKPLMLGNVISISQGCRLFFYLHFKRVIKYVFLIIFKNYGDEILI